MESFFEKIWREKYIESTWIGGLARQTYDFGHAFY